MRSARKGRPARNLASHPSPSSTVRRLCVAVAALTRLSPGQNPPPLAGEGRVGGLVAFPDLPARFPLPHPPPQAGEGIPKSSSHAALPSHPPCRRCAEQPLRRDQQEDNEDDEDG